MSAKYPGGIISANAVIPNPNTQTNTSGVWTVEQADYWTAKNQWPMPYPRQSLRVNSADSAYLTRTPASAGNRQKWTWSGWLKRSKLGVAQRVIAGGTTALLFQADDTLLFDFDGGSNYCYTSSVFRDVGAWYHTVFTLDTTLATSTDRAKLWINNVQQSLTFNGSIPLNGSGGINNNIAQYICSNDGTSQFCDLMLADSCLIDGLALTPSSFGQTDINTGAWIPQSYVGNYGTNGFYLPFINNSGADSFGVGIDSSVPNLNRVELGNTSVGYTVLGTMTYSVGAAAVNLRDNNPNTAAADSNGIATTTAMGYDFGRPIQIRKISTLTALANGVSNTITLSIQYSDDNSTWTTVSGSVTTHTISAGLGQANTSTISENGFHRYWRLIYASGTIGGDCWIATLDMFITNIGPNSWYPVNFSVAAGVGNDSLVDSPWNFGIDYSNGGEVRSNYCTLNPLRSSGTLANGNLQYTTTSGGVSQSIFATMGVSSGKWYFEMIVTGVSGTYYPAVGINTDLSISPTAQSGDTAAGYMYMLNGQKYNNSTLTNYGASFTTNDVIGVVLDMDAGTLTFYKNGSTQGQAFSGISGTAVPVVMGSSSANGYVNFGQRPFSYPQIGFKTFCTQNLPTPAIGATSTTLASAYMLPVLYTGNSSTQAVTTNFQPDLVWIKSRSTADTNVIQDVLRGARYYLQSNSTAAEATQADSDGVSAFTSTGFTLGYTDSDAWNKSPNNYVSWNWKAGGTGVSNTNGSITSTVSANPTAGFSIVTYSGNGTAGATVGHGLGVAPAMVIVKSKTISPSAWRTYNKNLANAATTLDLNSDAAADGTNGSSFNSTAPTSSVFSLGTADSTNNSSATYVAYCFAEVEGFSKIGKYTGNGSADGPFVYCGFRPRYIMVKRIDAAGDNWFVYDTARNPYNAADLRLYPNTAAAEASGINAFDLLSNGAKLRTLDTSFNASGGTFVFIAFAETPFNYSRAR